ncbi:MAG: 50S ribosomal protein L9 [Firmicutes bacterium]|mgnify:CR=1 FL=1|nr:50S ribosomal protein L9 [Bacillota bacterium]
MKVILQKDVKNLGKKGDVLEVAEGYGRNFLLPRGLAVEANAGNLRQIEQQKKAEAAKNTRELKQAQAVAEKLSGKGLTIRARVGGAGKLFGSITSQELADQLKEQLAVDIDKRKIDLKEPIKSLGSYSVTARIHPEVHVTFKVEVVPEE